MHFANLQRPTEIVPTGTIIAAANAAVPSGWLKCNGAAISRAEYPALFGAIGTIYGAGDGSTTFNLPELRGEFIRGWDDGRGIDVGRAIGSAQGDATRLLLNGASTASSPAGDSIAGIITHRPNVEAVGIDAFFYQQYDKRNSLSPAMDSRFGNAIETRSRSIALPYIIKF